MKIHSCFYQPAVRVLRKLIFAKNIRERIPTFIDTNCPA